MSKLLYFPTFVWAGLVAYRSIFSTAIEAKINLGGVLLHIIVYGMLAALAFFAMREPTQKKLSAAVIAIFVFGLLLELAQSFLPGRFPSPTDAAANGIGAAVAVLFLSKLYRR